MPKTVVRPGHKSKFRCYPKQPSGIFILKKFTNRGQFQPKDLKGQRFGLLVVMDVTHKGQGGYYWDCQCDCGKVSNVLATRLIQGITKSCGHLQGNKGVGKKHGMKYTRIYNTWRNMKGRCMNPKSQMYPQYGGRGIKVCERWLKFENFYEDMKEGYDDTLQIERDDVNGDYCKENCSWTTPQQQAKNKTNTAYVTYKGVTKRAHDWAALIGANPKSISRRVYLGWPPEHCLFGKQYERIKKLILAESTLNL